MKRADTTVEEYETATRRAPLSDESRSMLLRPQSKVLEEGGRRQCTPGPARIRRDQSPDRAEAPIVGWDKKFSLVKVSPLANWTKQNVWKLITEDNIPYNPLHDQGYTSIGCWPCTRAVLLGEDERAGRWSGFEKTECGLHTK